MILAALLDTLFRNWFSILIAWLTVKHWDSLHWIFKILLGLNIAYVVIGTLIAIITHVILLIEENKTNK